MSVKSVYNFVPAPKESEVFKPDWAEQVSHDLPFSDGESGEIEIKITTETPIFIRNGHSKDNESNEFSHYVIDGKKKYFIPATSLKGMFRNVLEIITSSRMNQTGSISEKNPITYGMRDMTNREYTADNAVVKSGWLMKRENDWVIESCKNNRIALTDIEREFVLEPHSLKGTNGIGKNELCKGYIKNKTLNFSFLRDLGRWVGEQYIFDGSGDFEGYIVLYGDIDNKRYDYIFSEPNGNTYSVDSKLVETLDNIENNGENKDDSLWLYFRKENWQPGIPVFFTLNEYMETVKHFGLTKLYRRNNSHYLHNLEPLKSYLNSDKKNRLDFAELLFGNVRSEALKGRVFISHAWTDNAETGKEEERILNSPKPSFYPAYLKQDGTKGQLKGAYKTYHNADAELRGFKRYPVHNDTKPNIESENENIASKFIPLQNGAIFCGKIRYFNLRPCEIGALVSAITFHGNSDDFFHSIGGAKPYGFGKIKIQIENFSDLSKYLKEFEFVMNTHLKDKQFVNQENIKELLSIASSPKDDSVDRLLQYPSIEIQIRGKKENEFNNYKKDKKFLEDYSERNGVYTIHSKVDNEFLQEKKREKEQEVLEQKKKQEERKKNITTLRNEIENLTENKKFDEAISKVNALGNIEKLQNKEEWILDLEERKKAYEEDEYINAMIERKDVEELQEFLNQNPFHKRADEIRKLINIAGPKEYPERYRTLDISKLLKEVPQWIRKKDIMISDFEDELMTDFQRAIGDEMKKKRKDWEDFQNKNTWQKVADILGNNLAQSLYAELTSE